MKLLEVIPIYDYTKYRFEAVFDDGTRTKFGSAAYENYLMHGDKRIRRLYRLRHLKDLKTNDPTRAGYLSMFLLWGDSQSLQENIKTYKKMFDL